MRYWPIGPTLNSEIRKLVMRVGVLTLSILVAVWLVPGSGLSCPSNTAGHEDEAHSHSAQPHTHTDAEPEHGNTHGAPDESHSGSTQDSSSHESDCCDSASDLPALHVVLASWQSRPEFTVAVAPLVIAVVEAVPRLATASQLRRLQPPAHPYERTRRPLLI